MTKDRLLSHIASRMPFAAKARLDGDLFDEMGFDSILLLDLIFALEGEFGLKFSDEDLSIEALRTPRRLLELIETCRRKSADSTPDSESASTTTPA